ncbi:MAG: disulfide oxidoreductase [Nitrospirota bacterium]|jgi:hypothetical protein
MGTTTRDFIYASLAHPGSGALLGAGCSSCPGQATESIAQAAMMHNIDPAELVAARNRVAGGSR